MSETTPPSDSYHRSSWSDLYDLVYHDYDVDMDYYLGVAARSVTKRILDLGCGTGRLALPLVERGFDVTGVDHSPVLLERCRAKAGGRDNPSLVLQDVRALELDRRFGAAIMPFRVMLHLSERGEQLELMRRVRAHLEPGGVFAFNVFVPDYEFMVRTQGIPYLKRHFVHADKEVVWQIVSRYDFSRQQVDTLNLVSVYEPDGRLQASHCLPHRLRWLTPSEVELLLLRAGFDEVELFGSFDRAPFGPDATEIVCEARIR